MRTTVKALIAAGVTLGAVLGAAAPASASIVTSEASLVNGQLTIVGSGAVPNSNVSVDDGPTTGRADAQGNFTISAGGFSEPSCVATLYDGSVSVEVTLSGCAPTISRPPAVPGPPTLVGPPSGTSATSTTEAHAPLFGFKTPLYTKGNPGAWSVTFQLTVAPG